MLLTPLAPWPAHAAAGALDSATALLVFKQLTAQASALGLGLRAPPPVPTTCCGRGCNGCVWAGYLGAAAYWRDDALAAIGARLSAGPP